MVQNESSEHNAPSPSADGPAGDFTACVAGPPASEADGAAEPAGEVKSGLAPTSPPPSAPVAAPAAVAPTGAAMEAVKGYIDLVINLLTDRADRLGRRNAWILVLTAAIIAACFYIFWRSDSIVEHLSQLDAIRKDNAAEREKLVKKRDELAAQFGDADFKLAAIDTKTKATNLVLDYLSIVQDFSKDYRSSGSYSKPDAVEKCRGRIASILNNKRSFSRALAVMQAVAAPKPDGINIEYDNQKVTVPTEMLKAMAGELAANGGIQVDAVAAKLMEVDERLRNVDADLARADERATHQN
jgi:cell division protein FtsB